MLQCRVGRESLVRVADKKTLKQRHNCHSFLPPSHTVESHIPEADLALCYSSWAPPDQTSSTGDTAALAAIVRALSADGCVYRGQQSPTIQSLYNHHVETPDEVIKFTAYYYYRPLPIYYQYTNAYKVERSTIRGEVKTALED